MMKQLFTLIISLGLICKVTIAVAQLSAQEIMERSIKFHDPAKNWNKSTIEIILQESRPNGADRMTELEINNRRNTFKLEQNRDGHQITYLVNKKSIKILLDGKNPTDTSLIRQFRLSEERVRTMRNYYTYLYGLPMKTLDEGANISEDLSESNFDNQKTYRIRITYDPEVGKDIWYFYIDRTDFHLVGYQFFHDEDKNDGEYITLEGIVNVAGMNLPRKRSWYTNANKAFLGSDIIVP
jgi:hypothetical protein